jgi:predicted translin family RNA/ssDNA-binding protein
MKEIKTPLQRHMDNAGNQLKEERQVNINSRKEYTVKIKVDTSELDCAIKKLKKINKLVKKIKAHQIV